MNRIKYPRTLHLPWSLGRTDDDKTLSNIDHFKSMDIVVTEKLDGENTTLYSDYSHARSIDSKHHPSRDWVKNLQYQIGWMIPHNWRICGENMYAAHSIKYDKLTSFFYVFSVWNSENQCLSWSDTVKFCEELNLKTVPVLYEGAWPDDFSNLLKPAFSNEPEGYVIRNADSFSYEDFSLNMAKYVRENHVQTDSNWRTNWKKNNLIDQKESSP